MMPHDVTQADREAAANTVPQGWPLGPEYAILHGTEDASKLVQAFAAHRIAAIAEERARVVLKPCQNCGFVPEKAG